VIESHIAGWIVLEIFLRLAKDKSLKYLMIIFCFVKVGSIHDFSLFN
jgi:hypothetical protein